MSWIRLRQLRDTANEPDEFRNGTAQYKDLWLTRREYDSPRARMEGLASNRTGVLAGLPVEIRTQDGESKLFVGVGLGVDGRGELVVLGVGGKCQLGERGSGTTESVEAGGVEFAAADLGLDDGEYILAVGFNEKVGETVSPNIETWEQVPVVGCYATARFGEGIEVDDLVIGMAVVADGQFKDLRPGVDRWFRRPAQFRAGELSLVTPEVKDGRLREVEVGRVIATEEGLIIQGRDVRVRIAPAIDLAPEALGLDLGTTEPIRQDWSIEQELSSLHNKLSELCSRLEAIEAGDG